MSRLYNTKWLASSYDQARSGHPAVIAEIMGRFPLPKDGDILDVGCGTGNETILLQRHANKPVWVVDNSRPMLNRVKKKLGDKVNAVLGDFENLVVFPNDRFVYVFSSFTYHQASNPRTFFKDVQRILKPSGRFVLLCATLEQAQQKPLVQFFPALPELDAQRYLSLDDLIEAFWEAGFVAVSWQSIFLETRKIDENYLTKVESCSVDSSLKILKDRSQDEFASGIELMRQAIGKELSYEIERTVISGVKPVDLRTNSKEYFSTVLPSAVYHNVSGGMLNNVIAVTTFKGKKLIAKQGTITSASNHLGAKLRSMSPERIRDENVSLKMLNSQRDSLPVRIPAVYDFDESNNVLLIEDISDHGILMSEQSKEFYESRECENAQILGEFLGKQHVIFRDRCPFIRGSESKDMEKWTWILGLRTTDLIPQLPSSMDRVKSAMNLKVQNLLAHQAINTLVNPELCPKNIFVYDIPDSLGVFDFEFCVGLGDPMYDLGFLVAHLIINSGLHTNHFSIKTSLDCCRKYRSINPSDYREADVTWYAACTIMYRFYGLSPLAVFQNHNEALKLVRCAEKIIMNTGGDLEELVS